MWKASILLLAGLTAALANPAIDIKAVVGNANEKNVQQTQDVLVAEAPLIPDKNNKVEQAPILIQAKAGVAGKGPVQEEQNLKIGVAPLKFNSTEEDRKNQVAEESAFARAIRSFKNDAVERALSMANVFADDKTYTIPTKGHRVTLTFNKDKKTKIEMALDLESSFTFVYGLTCKTTNCNNKQGPDLYQETGDKVMDKTTNAQQEFAYTFGSNPLKGKMFTDQIFNADGVVFDGKPFASIYQGSPTNPGPDDNAEGVLGLGFNAQSTVPSDFINELFELVKTNQYILFWRNKDDGAIVAGVKTLDGKCSATSTEFYKTFVDTKNNNLNHWWFYADVSASDKSDKQLLVKLDPTIDTIRLPKTYYDLLNIKDKKVADFTKLPTIELKLGDKESLKLQPSLYADKNDKDNGATVLVEQEDGKNGYQIVLGSPFFRQFCYILNRVDNTYKVGFTIPKDDQDNFASVRGISFAAIALVLLAQIFRF